MRWQGPDGYWASDEALYGHALAVTTDNWLAHAYLGRALFDRGRTDEAIEHQREALRISPGFAIWSIPRIPYMSPAAIGCNRVSWRGWPSCEKRVPSAARIFSGQFNPLEALTVTTSWSRTN